MKAKSTRVGLAYNHLERRIRRLPAGVALPTVPELRRELSVSQLTIERAYEALEARGLIERVRGRGVFVTDRLQTGEFAIVVRPALLRANSYPFYRTISDELIRMLQLENDGWQVRLHVGKHTESDVEFPGTLDLLDPVVLPRLRGVFSFHSLYELGPQVERAGVPLVYVGNPHGQHSVALAQEGFVRESLRHLRDMGCRSVGFIGHSLPANSRIGEVFVREAAACELECDRAWVEQIRAQPTERSGYESFTRLWANPRRPDGILVQDDVMCNGVLRATLQFGVNLPRNLRLITHANRNIELAYHLPITRIEQDPDELARRAVEMMMALVRKGRVEEPRVLLHGRLIKGETT